MVRSILIGLDGSPHSETAVQLGVQWAHRFDALLTGLGVVDEPAICGVEARMMRKAKKPSISTATTAIAASRCKPRRLKS